MTDILFRFDIDAPLETVRDALTTTSGITGFWTTRAEVPSAVGADVIVGFAVAPRPFDLRLEVSDEQTVVWRPQTFPPHWVGTTIRWDLEPAEAATTVAFRHGPFSDDADAGHAAYTWGRIMVQLKAYAETGVRDPVFSG
jgi:uncharacterized protein YndB with AHSA1/START domain